MKNRLGTWPMLLSWIFWLSLPVSQILAREDADATFPPEAIEFFEREVRPLLLEQCSSCHSAAVANTKGGLSLDTRAELLQGGDSGEAIVLGKPDESLLVEAIRRESYEMPPEKALSEKARLTLEKWVELGAPWSPERNVPDAGSDWLAQRAASHWAWQALGESTVPVVANDAWSEQPLDRFILARLNQEGVLPAEKADSTTLLRRLSFDLTGLPPSADVLREFAGLRENSAAYDRLVDELLASPQFGVRWGRHWLDLVRYAETLGHEFDYPIRHIWHYRDGVIDALNIDLPYRDFVFEHIVGDRSENPRMHPLTGINQSRVASGWWWLGESLHAPVDIKNDWALRLDNQIDVFSKTFLGMTVACARCHDHKFDAIGVKDYYGLSGIIESSRREYALTDPSGEIEVSRRQMSEALEDADAGAVVMLGTIDTPEMEQWLELAIVKLRSLDAAQQRVALPDASPLILLRLLLANDAEVSAVPFSQRWAELGAQLTAAQGSFDAWESESELYVDFSNGLPQDWSVNAAVVPQLPGRYDWFSTSLPLPMRTGIFSSQVAGRKAALTLTSPTFDVSRTHVCVKLRGKSVQSSVVVSNYFMQEFHGLLFGDLRKPIDQPSDSGWISHAGDLNKYIGHPAYLKFEDEDVAWFELQEIRFADRAPPVEEPSRFALDLLQNSRDAEDELKLLLAEKLAQAWQSVMDQEALSNEVVRALIKLSIDQDIPLPVAEKQRLQEKAAKLQAIDALTPPPTVILATADGTGRDATIALRGNPHRRGDRVARGCMTTLVTAELPSSSSSGRWELAQSLIDGQHPLTARVMVNRVWHHLLGRGLAASPDNLGVLGGRPTHPELLDYLAKEFVRHGWSVKWLVREIVRSQTYQLSSQLTEQQRLLDADGSLLSHRAVRRLSAEALRDSMLSTVGSLDLQLAGPSVPVFLTDQMTGRGRPGTSGPLDGNNRRTTFIEIRRNFLNPFLMAFDFPMPSTAVGDRNASNVPAQALGLLNDPLVFELTKRWAENGSRIAEPDRRAAWMIQNAFSRPATDLEINECLGFVGDNPDGWQELAHVLLNAKEFSYLK